MTPEEIEAIEARIAAIDVAISKGESSVQYADRMVTYRSVDALLTARAHFVGLLGVAEGRSRQTLVYANKGFGS